MSAFAILLAGSVILSYAHAAESKGFSATYVAKDAHLAQVYLFVEYYSAGRTATSPAAKKLARELNRALSTSFQPIMGGGRGAVRAHCNIVLRDWKDGEGDPNFQVRCETSAGGTEVAPFVSMDLPETVADVMKLVNALMIEHRRRIAHPG